MSDILQQILRNMQAGAGAADTRPSDLNPLLEQLRQAGLGRQVDSWIGTGPNEPVDPQVLEQALGGRAGASGGGGLGDLLGGLLGGGGSQSGGGAMGGMLGGLLAYALPAIINAMTPRGRVADEDVPAGGLGSILESLTRGSQAGPDGGDAPLPGSADRDLAGMLGRALNQRR